MKPLFIIFFILILSIPEVHARKIKTKHTTPKQTEKSINAISSDSVISLSTDSLIFVDKIQPGIRFYGFDKTVTSNIESCFITNNLQVEIKGMEILITYFDMQGRQLHKRNVEIKCDISAGETKRADFKSWDTQKSFYFYQSVKPKRQATPFSVKIDLLSIKY